MLLLRSIKQHRVEIDPRGEKKKCAKESEARAATHALFRQQLVVLLLLLEGALLSRLPLSLSPGHARGQLALKRARRLQLLQSTQRPASPPRRTKLPAVASLQQTQEART